MRIPPKHLARLFVEQVTEHPETHNQDTWECGTTKCAAGWGLHFAKIPITAGSEVLVSDCPDWLVKELADSMYLDHLDRPTLRIRDVGRVLYGLTRTQAGKIFFDCDERQSVAAMREIHNL